MAEIKQKKKLCKDCPYFDRVEVPYSGNINTDIVIVGESPGKEEILVGKPFVGVSGKLLDKLLQSIGLNRDSVFIANSCRCMIDKDNDKIKEINTAMAICRKFLEVAISRIKPRLIICLGSVALKQVLKLQKITENRGKFFQSKEFDCYVFPTFHPASILRKGVSKDYPNKPYDMMSMHEKVLFSDFQAIKSFIHTGNINSGINVDKYVKTDKLLIPDDCKVVAIDFETTNAKHFDKSFKILSLAVSCEEGRSQVFLSNGDNKLPDDVLQLLANPKISKIVALRPFEEATSLLHLNTEIRGNIHDVLVMAHLLDENYKRYNLEEVAGLYTNMKNIKSLAEGKRHDIGSLSEESLIKYNGCDADATLKVFNVLIKKIKEDKLLARYYKYFIMPALDLCKDMYLNGCKVGLEALKQSILEAERMLKEFEDECFSLIHPSIIEKHKDKLKLTRKEFLKDVLFRDPKGFKLKPKSEYVTKKTKEPQITEEHLKMFSDNKFVQSYFKWNKLMKIYSTYLLKLNDFVYQDGRVHHQTLLNRTVSGRTVILEPPLQTIPQRHPYAYLIRKCFVADDGELLCIRDLSQSEFRIIGWLAGDTNILNAVNSGLDLHTKTASVINNIPINEVTKEMRQKAKGVGFGLLYGMSAQGLQFYLKEEYNLDLTLNECKRFREAFFSKPNGYYKLMDYYKKQEVMAVTKGYVVSPLGRYRRLPEAQSQDIETRNRAIRQAINFPVSSFSSDLGLIGAFLFNQEIKSNPKYKNKVKPMIFIHDSFMFSAPEDLIDETALLLKDCMTNRAKEYIKKFFNITVGYRIDSDRKQGKNWAELQEIKD